MMTSFLNCMPSFDNEFIELNKPIKIKFCPICQAPSNFLLVCLVHCQKMTNNRKKM